MSKSRIEAHVLNIFAGRVADEPTWDVPLDEYLHHWAVPLSVMEDEGARRIGTAFHFSRLGHLFSARHCVDEALHASHRGVDQGSESNNVRVLVAIAAVAIAPRGSSP
jgi:hypothetical protein